MPLPKDDTTPPVTKICLVIELYLRFPVSEPCGLYGPSCYHLPLCLQRQCGKFTGMKCGAQTDRSERPTERAAAVNRRNDRSKRTRARNGASYRNEPKQMGRRNRAKSAFIRPDWANNAFIRQWWARNTVVRARVHVSRMLFTCTNVLSSCATTSICIKCSFARKLCSYERPSRPRGAYKHRFRPRASYQSSSRPPIAHRNTGNHHRESSQPHRAASDRLC